MKFNEGMVSVSYKWISILFLSIFITGCNFPISSPDTIIHTIQKGTDTPDTGGNQALSPTHTPVPPGVSCPVALGAPAIPELRSPSDWAIDVLSYLNQGGSVSGLMEAMPDLNQHDLDGLVAAPADLDGDGYEDFVITLSDQGAQEAGETPTESALFIFTCDQDEYRLVHAASAMPDADRFHLYQLLDLTGDGLSELLVMQKFCGAHTCFQAWEVLQWQTNQFVNILDGRSDDLPTPILEIHGPKDDGSMIIGITGTGVLSAGAGPSRATTRLWHWAEGKSLFIVTEEHLSSPSFRIHALHDADRAAYNGDFDTALIGYQRVIEDSGLDDYPFGDDGHEQLSAYALYRSMLLWIQFGDLDQAAATLSFLQEAHPPGRLGEGFSALAKQVWQAYQTQPDLEHACQIAQAFAVEDRGKVLDPLNYGYANKVYSAVDICPYTE
jgi:hypothetical protein